MRLWTIQPPEVHELIETKGVYHCDPDKSNFMDMVAFQKAYDWMVEQMILLVGPPPKPSIEYPIWAWHTHNWKQQKPDLRCAGLAKAKTTQVLMEVEIPDDQVLLSDHGKWHFVLNDWWLSSAQSSEEDDELHMWLETLSPPQQTIVRRASWSRIFDIHPMKSDWQTWGQYIQATFWELRKDQVISSRFFVAR